MVTLVQNLWYPLAESRLVVDALGHSVLCHNRISSKVQKSFWSCSHVNTCQKYTLYINLHILLNILSTTTLNIQESRKFIKSLKRQQELIKKTKIHCVLLSYELLSTKIYYTSIYIFYIFWFSRQI